MSVTKTFGKNIRRLRLQKNLSQEDLGALANLHRTYIGAVERSERNITLINAEKIAVALKVHLIECLIDLDDAK